jgi:hypothetical protein
MKHLVQPQCTSVGPKGDGLRRTVVWLRRRWAAALAVVVGALVWGVDVAFLRDLLLILPLVYAITAAIGRLQAAWPVLIASFLLLLGASTQSWVSDDAVIIGVTAAALLIGTAIGRDRRLLALQGGDRARSPAGPDERSPRLLVADQRDRNRSPARPLRRSASCVAASRRESGPPAFLHRATCPLRGGPAGRSLQQAEGVGTAVWAYRVGDEKFEQFGHTLLATLFPTVARRPVLAVGCIRHRRRSARRTPPGRESVRARRSRPCGQVRPMDPRPGSRLAPQR